MSSASNRRSGDRAHLAGAKTVGGRKSGDIAASKSVSCEQKPISILRRSLSGKENPRSVVPLQKSAIRAVPRIDKAAAAVIPVRCSTSTVPRGRSSGPSEFVNDLRSLGEGNKNRFQDCKKIGGLGSEFAKKGVDVNVVKSERKSSSFRIWNDNSDKFPSHSSSLGKSSEIDDAENSNSGSVQSLVELADLCTDKAQENCSHQIAVLDNSNGSDFPQEKAGMVAGIKCSSKLHEKLAFLEGKVKRIAADIRKTKDMLDKNKSDASKVILSDIQDKISGIEKAMGCVVSDSSYSRKNAFGETTAMENGNKTVNSIKGMNGQELEARLFPHHKLLRARTTSKQNSQINCELKEEDKLNAVQVQVVENLVGAEDAASMEEHDSKANTNDGKECSGPREVRERDGAPTLGTHDSSIKSKEKILEDTVLTTNERFDEIDRQGSRQPLRTREEVQDVFVHQVNEIGSKTSTGGWFVSEGQSVLLAHDDGSCSFYDIVNSEEKAVYKPPVGISPNIWNDCWIIRAPGSDGCSGKYVMAASAGNALESGFCSWDFHSKRVQAYHIESGGAAAATSRTVLSPLPPNTIYRRIAHVPLPEARQWWYNPCGPLLVSSATSQRVVKMFDIRDGEQIMKWELQKPLLAMDHSSPLQWKNRGAIVVAEAETISLWDVNSLNPRSLLSISLPGRRISALHVFNNDAELGGGIRQRITSSEYEGNDGIFCTVDSIYVMDFRTSTGLGLRIPKMGTSAHSAFSRRESVYIGCVNMRLSGAAWPCFQVQQYSMRSQGLVGTCTLPQANAHSHCSAMTQVWGSSSLVMAVSALGLFVFDALKDDALQEIIGPDDMLHPSFDYAASRVLLISRDRPAMWRFL